MLTLVIERSTRRPGWALFRGAAGILDRVLDEEPSRGPDWPARLGQDLAKAGVQPAAIDRFVAGLGPGSFSGTRAAVAALQGMALPGGHDLVGVSSAAGLAFALLTERASGGVHTPVAVVGDARRERLWCAVYTLDSAARLTVLGNGAAHSPTHDAADFVLTTGSELPGHLPPAAAVVSPDWDRIGARLASVVPATQLVAGIRLPTAAEVGRLLFSDPAAARTDPLPIYLHPAVAEVRP